MLLKFLIACSRPEADPHLQLVSALCMSLMLVIWHGCRRQQLHEHDLVNQLHLSSFAKSKVQQAAQIHGQSFSHSMQGVDSTISQQLQRMIAS